MSIEARRIEVITSTQHNPQHGVICSRGPKPDPLIRCQVPMSRCEQSKIQSLKNTCCGSPPSFRGILGVPASSDVPTHGAERAFEGSTSLCCASCDSSAGTRTCVWGQSLALGSRDFQASRGETCCEAPMEEIIQMCRQ